MDLPSRFLVEFSKRFATRKKAVRQFFDGLYAYQLLSEFGTDPTEAIMEKNTADMSVE